MIRDIINVYIYIDRALQATCRATAVVPLFHRMPTRQDIGPALRVNRFDCMYNNNSAEIVQLSFQVVRQPQHPQHSTPFSEEMRGLPELQLSLIHI